MSAARQLPSKHKQHGNHKHCAFEQIRLNRVDSAVDELRAVILDLNLHTVGQLGLNLGDAGLDPFRHVAAVLAREHHSRADDRLVAIEGRRPGAELGPGLYLGHVFDQKRLDPGAEFERQVGDIFRVIHAAQSADGELLSAAADDAAACILDVLRDKVGQFAESHAHLGQRIGFGLDDELLFVAAALVDFGDARHSAKQWLDHIFLDFAQLDQLLQFRRGFIFRVGTVIRRCSKKFPPGPC